MDATGVPLPDATLKAGEKPTPCCWGAVGGPWDDTLPREQRARNAAC